jgi:hypothetical protein
MAWDFETTSLVKARKDYWCDACIWIDETLCNFIDDLTFTEKRHLVVARRQKGRIIKGQIYIKTKGKWDGEFSVFRAIPEVNRICHAHDVYEY